MIKFKQHSNSPQSSGRITSHPVKTFSHGTLFEKKLCSVIRRMYTDNKVKLILGNIDISIPFEVGVKQWDIVAPVLFLFIIMEFAETIEKEQVRNDLKMIKFKQHSNSPQSSGRITSQPAKTFSHVTLFKFFI